MWSRMWGRLSRRRSDFERRWSELKAIRFSIADQRAKLERARQSGAAQADVSRIEVNLQWLEQSLQQMRERYDKPHAEHHRFAAEHLIEPLAHVL
jgi:hypothetical protein